jgi:hypothetical protein
MQNTRTGSEVKILFIGNSYTSRNNLPRLLADLAKQAEPPRALRTESIVAGGASLRRHWNAGKAQEAIRRTDWHYVVLQEQSTLPVKNTQRYHDNVRLFAAEIAAHGARLALYLTWARQHAPATQDVITRAVTDIAAEVDGLVVAVGTAWERALREIPELRLYTEDGSHPTSAGSYLAACVFHTALFGEGVHDESVADALKVDRVAARKLQAIALACRTPEELS